jgi:hypothetical protein
MASRMKRKKTDPSKGVVASKSAEKRALEAIKSRGIVMPGAGVPKKTAPMGARATSEHGIASARMKVDMSEMSDLMRVLSKMSSKGVPLRSVSGGYPIDWFTGEEAVRKTAVLSSKIIKKRNWGRCFRDHVGGAYEFMQDASSGFAFAGTRSDLTADADHYDVFDVTGEQRIRTRRIAFTNEQLCRGDADIGNHINAIVSTSLMAEIKADLGPFDASDVTLYGLLLAMVEQHGLYPGIHFSRRAMPTTSGDGYFISFAIQWIYSPALDEEDEEDFEADDVVPIHFDYPTEPEEAYLTDVSFEYGHPKGGYGLRVTEYAKSCPRCEVGKVVDVTPPDMDGVMKMCKGCGWSAMTSATELAIRMHGGKYA